LKTVLLLAAVLAVAYIAAQASAPQAAYEDADLPDQQTTLLEDVEIAMDPSTYTPVGVPPIAEADNTRAFLDMLAYSEGTDGPDGYRTMFGGRLFDSYADHPRQYFPFTDGAGRQLKTSAAGRYQFLARTWDGLRSKLGLPDFGPASQDAAALELVRQRGALNDVKAGRITEACAKCAPIWASLPGAGYSQPERKITSLLAAYRTAGGYLEA
jgi:muramidase (phage lysozyme)